MEGGQIFSFHFYKQKIVFNKIFFDKILAIQIDIKSPFGLVYFLCMNKINYPRSCLFLFDIR